MRLWTIQTEGAYNKLLDTGILKGDWRRVERSFKPAYQWLVSEIGWKRPPIWAWREKPDLRVAGHLFNGEPGYRLEVEVDNKLVVQSNFEAWHFVLNNQHLSLNAVDDDFEFVESAPAERSNSWKQIFDLDKFKNGWSGKIQAVIPHIEVDWVIKATRFKAR